MKTIKQIVPSILVLAMLVPGTADAQVRPWHFSIEGGLADANLERFRNETWDEALQIQGSVGYDFFTGSWGVLTGEFALGTTISEGDYRVPRARPLRDNAGEWDATTLGLFLTYRTDEVVFYPLARVGIQHSEVSTSTVLLRLPDRDSGDDTGLAAGLGAGFRFSPNAALELTWTRQFSFLDENLDVIALGVRF